MIFWWQLQAIKSSKIFNMLITPVSPLPGVWNCVVVQSALLVLLLKYVISPAFSNKNLSEIKVFYFTLNIELILASMFKERICRSLQTLATVLPSKSMPSRTITIMFFDV